MGGGRKEGEERERENERTRKMWFSVEMTDASVIGVYLSCTEYFPNGVSAVHYKVLGTPSSA